MFFYLFFYICVICVSMMSTCLHVYVCCAFLFYVMFIICMSIACCAFYFLRIYFYLIVLFYFVGTCSEFIICQSSRRLSRRSLWMASSAACRSALAKDTSKVSTRAAAATNSFVFVLFIQNKSIKLYTFSVLTNTDRHNFINLTHFSILEHPKYFQY